VPLARLASISRSLLLASTLVAAVGLSFTGCKSPNDLPELVERHDAFEVLELPLATVLEKPWSVELDAYDLGSERIGVARYSVSKATVDDLPVYAVRTELALTTDPLGISSDVEFYFERKIPYAIVGMRAKGGLAGSRGPDGALAPLSSIQRAGKDEVVYLRMLQGVPFSIYNLTLMDAVGPWIWPRMLPTPQHRMDIHEFDVLTGKLNTAQLTVSSADETQLEIRNSFTGAVWKWSTDGKLLFTNAITYGLVELFAKGTRPARPPTPKEWKGFFLPSELPERPADFDLAHLATLKVCPTRKACGTGVLISNEGHILTARHVAFGRDVVPETKIAPDAEIYVPSMGSHGKATVVYSDPHADFAILKLKTPDPSKLPQPLLCVPIARRSPSPGEKLWAIGFPMKAEFDGIARFSDSFRKFTAIGTLLPFTVTGTGKKTDPTWFIDPDNTFMQSMVTRPGMSGGPQLDSKGELIGILSRVQNYFPLERDNPLTEHEKTLSVSYRVSSVYARTEAALGEAETKRIFSCERKSAPQLVDGSRLDGSEAQILKQIPEGQDVVLLERVIREAGASVSGFLELLAKSDFAGQKAAWLGYARQVQDPKTELGILVRRAARAVVYQPPHQALLVSIWDRYPLQISGGQTPGAAGADRQTFVEEIVDSQISAVFSRMGQTASFDLTEDQLNELFDRIVTYSIGRAAEMIR